MKHTYINHILLIILTYFWLGRYLWEPSMANLETFSFSSRTFGHCNTQNLFHFPVFFILNFAFWEISRWQTIHTAHATWSSNESYHVVDHVILTNVIWGNETSCMMEYVEGKARCPLGKPRGIGLYESKGPLKRPWKKETLHAEWHQPTTCTLCFNIEQWKTTSCLPSKPRVQWFLDFVITS